MCWRCAGNTACAGWSTSAPYMPSRRTPTAGCCGETSSFSPDAVAGSYAKTKAEATRDVLDAAAAGLDAVVVHPSGILGPYDNAGNHLVQVIRDYMTGKLPACVRGGYDMVDVRDVAWGCVAAALRGRKGECYILSNRRCNISDLLEMARRVCGGRRLPVLPMGLARAAAPLLAAFARMRGRRPLYTAYSLQALASSDRFSHDKATRELGYRPRDLRLTVRDTVRWLQSHGVQPRRTPRAAPPRGAGGGLSLQQMKRRGCRRFYSAATSFFVRIIPTRRFHESRLRQIWKNTLNQPGA